MADVTLASGDHRIHFLWIVWGLRGQAREFRNFAAHAAGSTEDEFAWIERIQTSFAMIAAPGATVFYHVGETAPEQLSAWTFHESTTKTIFNVDLPASVEPGSKVWFTAFWFNPRSQSGPACTPMSTFLQFGGLSMAA